MNLKGYKIIATLNKEEVELYILDKYRTYTSSGNEDVYLCKDTSGDAYTIRASDILKFV